MMSPRSRWCLCGVMCSILLVSTAGAQVPRFGFWADPYEYGPSIAIKTRVVDLDNDGFLDILNPIGGPGSAGPRVYWNRGNGTFDSQHLPRPTIGPGYVGSSIPVGVGDVDGDGDLDLLIPQSMPWTVPGYPPLIYINDGARRFRCDSYHRFPVASMTCLGGELCDVDRDGDLDALLWVAIGQSRTLRLFLNDGAATFAEAPSGAVPQIVDSISFLAPIDVDGDRDQDLFVAVFAAYIGPAPSLLLVNDGSGRFSIGATYPPAWARHASTGDVTGDGLPDLFLACDLQDRLYINDGAGGLVEESARLPVRKTNPGGDRTAGSCLSDLDGDGDLDLVFTGWFAQSGMKGPQVWLNDGRGFFSVSPAGTIRGGNEYSWEDVAAADVDRDGDADLLGTLILGNSGAAALRVLPGLDRHARVPSSVARSENLTIDLEALGGRWVVPFVGAPASILWIPPIGAWGLDLVQAVPLPPVFFSDTLPRQSVLAVPNDPSLSGAVARVQSIHIATSGPEPRVRASNWLQFRVR